MILDSSMLQFLFAPFVASLILTGIHSYLGVHVVQRGVIFVDLSLAQIAAFGGTIALLMPISGGDAHSPAVYWVSLAFTFVGAFVFATIRSRHAKIPQEAIIGICYAVASAASILAMSKATSESEHLKDMLVGNILAVSWPEVEHTALLYGAIGLFHFIFRRQFLAISRDHDAAEASGLSTRLWDFLFYASFGFVVTSSVAMYRAAMAWPRVPASRPSSRSSARKVTCALKRSALKSVDGAAATAEATISALRTNGRIMGPPATSYTFKTRRTGGVPAGPDRCYFFAAPCGVSSAGRSPRTYCTPARMCASIGVSL